MRGEVQCPIFKAPWLGPWARLLWKWPRNIQARVWPRSGCDTLSSHIFTLPILPPGNPRCMNHSSCHHKVEPLSLCTAYVNWTLSRKHSFHSTAFRRPDRVLHVPGRLCWNVISVLLSRVLEWQHSNREQDTRGGMLNPSVFHVTVTVGVQKGNGTKVPVPIASRSP